MRDTPSYSCFATRLACTGAQRGELYRVPHLLIWDAALASLPQVTHLPPCQSRGSRSSAPNQTKPNPRGRVLSPSTRLYPAPSQLGTATITSILHRREEPAHSRPSESHGPHCVPCPIGDMISEP
ncbi:hypothetical protein VTN77DRAFT_101 [Rasamsonia byssochlamydoides]|uniref:uncharacterized protein n=1 Tax=Rasamsonia byssochlamydoides TaxID=89139 RepID=UPI00374304D5